MAKKNSLLAQLVGYCRETSPLDKRFYLCLELIFFHEKWAKRSSFFKFFSSLARRCRWRVNLCRFFEKNARETVPQDFFSHIAKTTSIANNGR